MNKINALFKIILLNVAVLSSLSFGAIGRDQSNLVGLRYGPNLSWGGMVNTPIVWGQWVPQAAVGMRYTWLEPLAPLNYGDPIGFASAYLRMDASIEVTPFYGGYRAGLGLRPFRINPQIEFNFVYESYFYFKSNLEMVNADVKGGGHIAETWNSDYILDNVGKSNSDFDYAQLFDMSIDFSYTFPHGGIIGIGAHYVLSDISTDFEGKSYDYERNIPVFSRDYIIELQSFGRFPVNDLVSVVYDGMYIKTGLLRSGGSVKKESLSYRMMLLGAHFSWKEGLRNVVVKAGMWSRDKKRFYNGSFAQQLLVQLEYEGYFSFPFHSNFSK
ncbi:MULTISPECIES: hypothetical protein [unclassified Fibrobacter]|uniref:hypothetical protein n=1 Tax=unclassified Fibrobacter TaxID=2634177 RepID=UPI0009137BF1|nr:MULTISPECIES: hypothetical protein [unclassified Fibrobacter]SHK36654.1 hypothetical protein SAMN05720759_102141 [Fibrobacter sp. UWB12]SIN90391.1 hypothetical protein SAMN05720758_0502 [Fibrobacter sp. UWB11]